MASEHSDPHLWSKITGKYISDNGQWSKDIRKIINKHITPDVPSELWHYCPLSALQGIASSASIYMSDLASMNDFKEGRWIRDKIISQLQAGTLEQQDFLRYLKSTELQFMIGPFVVSLSDDPDLLSQWRSYANGGKGVAIGFQSKQLGIPLFVYEREQMGGEIVLTRVIYEKHAQAEIVNKIVSLIDSIIRDTRQIGYKDKSGIFVACAAMINMYIHYLSPLFKNTAFSEEREWRIIFYPKGSIMNQWKKDISKIEIGNLDDQKNMKFRFHEDDMIKYFLFPPKKSLSPMISGVILGPLCKIRDEDIALFLLASGVRDFSVGRSEASLR